MTNRTPEMNCLLCDGRMANATGSHFAPAWVIEPTIGARNYEAAYSIDLGNLEIEAHFGRSRLDNPNTTVTKNGHVADYIFCQDCEDGLGRLESIVAPLLQKRIYEDRFSQQFIISKHPNGVKIKECKQLSASLFHVFVYSVVWRVCLQQRLSQKASPLHPLIEERMQLFLSLLVHKPMKEIAETTFKLPFPYTIITADNIAPQNATYINIDPTVDNPTAFFLGKFIVLLHLDDRIPETGNGLQLSPEIQQGQFSNRNTNERARIVFISEEEWNKSNLYISSITAEKWMYKAREKVSSFRKISMVEAELLLRQETERIVASTGQNHTEAIQIAVVRLTNEN